MMMMMIMIIIIIIIIILIITFDQSKRAPEEAELLQKNCENLKLGAKIPNI